MKNNRSALIFIVSIVVIIGAASFLYNRLTKNIQVDPFVVQNGIDISSNEANTTEESHNHSAEEESHNHDHDHAHEDSSEELQPAPDFTVYDSSGNPVNLSNYIGKPVVLNFWASWCGPCKSEMPGFNNLYQKYGNEIEFLMVNLTDGFQETQEKAQAFVDEEGYSFPILFDTESTAAISYGVSSIPATYLINTEGKLVAYAVGAISEDDLENALEMIWNK